MNHKLGFGLMRLPLLDANDQSSIDMPTLEKMVDTFLERGFSYFDTAYMYHNFKSEIFIREALVKRHNRNEFTLADKLPTMFLEKEGDQERIFDEQLEKCGVEYFDYYLLHALGTDNYAKAQKYESFDFLRKQKSDGKIRKIGFSYHDNAKLLNEILETHSDIDFVQLQINYLDWESNVIQSKACYEVCKKHNKPVIVMEPIRGGTLAKVPKEVEKLFKSSKMSSPAEWALRFASNLDNVQIVLSGMSNLEQMEENTAFMQNSKKLNSEEEKTIEKAAKFILSQNAIPCTACRYCVDACPQKINIPTYFSLYNEEQLNINHLFSIQQTYYLNECKSHGKASDCIKCRKCENSCPQHLKITDYLEQVAKTFEK